MWHCEITVTPCVVWPSINDGNAGVSRFLQLNFLAAVRTKCLEFIVRVAWHLRYLTKASRLIDQECMY